MRELRTYQQSIVDYCGNAIANNANYSGVICLPTGGGKTVVFAEMAELAASNGYSVLIITDSRKLHEQSARYFASYTTIQAGCKASDIAIENGMIYIAMAQTLSRRKGLCEALSTISNLIVIIDEVHIKTTCKPLEYLGDKVIRLGFTATPQADHLEEYFSEIHIGSDIASLVVSGYLSPCKSWVRRVVDTTTLKKSKGEYSEQSQEAAFKSGLSGLVDDLRTFRFNKALVFTASIKHCQEVAAYLRGAGIVCAEVHSECDELEAFHNGSANVCVSVGMLTKGYDFPAIDLVILFRKTTSLPLYLQMCGRGSRTSEGKEFWNLVDYGENVPPHNLWAIDRKWQLAKPENMDKDGTSCINGVGLCECRSCGHVQIEKFEACPNCGAVVELPKPEMKQTALLEWNSADVWAMDAETLYNHSVATFSRKRGIAIAKRKGDAFLREYGKIAGYSPNWVETVKRYIYG